MLLLCDLTITEGGSLGPCLPSGLLPVDASKKDGQPSGPIVTIGRRTVIDQYLPSNTRPFFVLCHPNSYFAYCRWASKRGHRHHRILPVSHVDEQGLPTIRHSGAIRYAARRAVSEGQGKTFLQLIDLGPQPDAAPASPGQNEEPSYLMPTTCSEFLEEGCVATLPGLPRGGGGISTTITTLPPPPQEEGATAAPASIHHRTYARVGVVGNPSDMFNGKTLSCSVGNYFASATLTPTSMKRPAPKNRKEGEEQDDEDDEDDDEGDISLKAHPFLDSKAFSDLEEISLITKEWGYGGGQRLMMATCKKFFEYVSRALDQLDTKDNAKPLTDSLKERKFTLRYDSNIPMQVGLAGSSAIIVSILKCLIDFFEVTRSDVCPLVESVKKQYEKGAPIVTLSSLLSEDQLPTLALKVETEELGISAGLQDRVVQCKQGLIHMDFGEDRMTKYWGGDLGVYSRLDPAKLPPLYLAVSFSGSDSGKMHNNVKERWTNKDPEVMAAVEEWKSFVDASVKALEESNHEAFADCVDGNFATRLRIYTAKCLGTKNLRMKEIATKHGAAAKLPGSGGAVLVVPRQGTDLEALTLDYESSGFAFVQLRPVA